MPRRGMICAGAGGRKNVSFAPKERIFRLERTYLWTEVIIPAGERATETAAKLRSLQIVKKI